MKHNKIIMGFISFLFPGLGHILLSEYKKGSILLVTSIGVTILTIGIPILSFILMILIVYSILDCLKLIDKKKDKTN